MFPTFDPPPRNIQNAIGHWVVVALNIKDRCFQYIDSLYSSDCKTGWVVFNRMIRSIKQIWLYTSEDLKPPLSPISIDHFETHYMNTVKQTDK